MVRAADGRIVGARRNGHCYLSVGDDRGESFLLDFAHSLELADALEQPAPIRVSDCQGQVLRLRVVEATVSEAGATPVHLMLGQNRHEPHGRPATPTGPWALSFEQGARLGAAIRELVVA